MLTTIIPGATGDGSSSVTVPVSVFADAVVVDGNGGDDSLTLDASLGTFLPDVSSITFHGDGHLTGDSLVLTGGTSASLAHTATGPGAGVLDWSGLSVHFDGLE